MQEYLIRLLIFIPVIGSMIWGSLWLWRKTQTGVGPSWMGGQSNRALRVVEAISVGTGCRLVVVKFRERELLLAINRTHSVLLAENTGLPSESPTDA